MKLINILFILLITACSMGDSKDSLSNSIPIANAGIDQNVNTTSLVTLDGSSSSDANTDNLTYSWNITSKPTRSSATLSDTTVVNPTFSADTDGAYVIQLIVNDGTVDSRADTVTINATTANSAPVSNAGPDQNVYVLSTVTLDGSSSSDTNSDNLTYSWNITSNPTGSSATLSDTTVVNPTFSADTDGAYVIQLIVNDGTVDSSADSISVTVIPGAKNIILLIGDGMGAEHVKAARWKEVGIDGKLHMDEMLNSGFIQTASANNLITDSAAASTAMATGIKTNNGVISLDPSLNILTTILEKAKPLGKSVGLITTVQISHATPAAFGAHVESRSNMTEIATQLLDNNIDILLGGGEDEFLPSSVTGCFPEPGERNDNKNLINEAIIKGYTYVCDSASLAEVNSSNTNKLIGLFSDEGMTRTFSPSLDFMLEKALTILSKNKNGFFLMVEGGQIDWASHANDAINTINDTVDFDKTVKIAKEFNLMNKDTLVIVTADHESGGMSTTLNSTGLPSEDGPFYMPNGTKFYINWSTIGHTDSNVPIKAIGYNANLFQGTNENTFIYEVMKQSFGL